MLKIKGEYRRTKRLVVRVLIELQPVRFGNRQAKRFRKKLSKVSFFESIGVPLSILLDLYSNSIKDQCEGNLGDHQAQDRIRVISVMLE